MPVDHTTALQMKTVPITVIELHPFNTLNFVWQRRKTVARPTVAVDAIDTVSLGFDNISEPIFATALCFS